MKHKKPTSVIAPDHPWHTLALEDVERILGTKKESGLEGPIVALRLKKYGRNKLPEKRDLGFVGRFLRQFRSPLVLILVAAAGATLFLREYVDLTVIVIALLVNVLIGALQEERASAAFKKLSAAQERFATVLRAGKRKRIRTKDIVIGDIVLIEAGNTIPADIRLVRADSLETNEAVLTGEWKGVYKHSAKLEEEEVALAEQANMAWMGTVATAGQGQGIVVATGAATELGKIAESLTTEEEVVTPIKKSIKNLATFVSLLVVVASLLIILLGILRDLAFSQMLLVAIAVAVSVVPEGLPAAVTVVLAIGMERILARGGLVRNLAAAETLGSTTVIMTDKTGTLTEAAMRLTELATYAHIRGFESGADGRLLLLHATAASDAFVEASGDGKVVHGRPIERAIIERGLEEGILEEVKKNFARLDFQPFSSERRFAASLNYFEGNEKERVIISGSPEHILDAATHVLYHTDAKRLSEADKKALSAYLNEGTGAGKRFIAIAYTNVTWKHFPKHALTLEDVRKKDLVFVGFVVFEDPVREDVKKSIAAAKRAGAHVVMVTGDNPQTALGIAVEAGIVERKTEVLTGADVEEMNDKELVAALRTHTIFARVLPSQKLRIAKLFRDRSEIVAMTGDGVNDAPALRAADIGIALGSGTDVAKEASDLVLVNNSFTIIVRAIEEGRRIMDNLKKIVIHLVTASFGELFLVVGGLVFAMPLPILPVQILWMNIVQGGLLNFAFAFEGKEEGIMRRNPRDPEVHELLSPRVRSFILAAGTIIGLFTLFLFIVLVRTGAPIERIRTIMFVALSLDGLLFTLLLKNVHKPVWRTNMLTNRFLLLALGISSVVLLASLFLPPLQSLLSLTALSFKDFTLLAGVAFFIIFVVEGVKRVLFRD